MTTLITAAMETSNTVTHCEKVFYIPVKRLFKFPSQYKPGAYERRFTVGGVVNYKQEVL